MVSCLGQQPEVASLLSITKFNGMPHHSGDSWHQENGERLSCHCVCDGTLGKLLVQSKLVDSSTAADGAL